MLQDNLGRNLYVGAGRGGSEPPGTRGLWQGKEVLDDPQFPEELEHRSGLAELLELVAAALLNVPALVVTGAYDATCPPSLGAALAETLLEVTSRSSCPHPERPSTEGTRCQPHRTSAR